MIVVPVVTVVTLMTEVTVVTVVTVMTVVIEVTKNFLHQQTFVTIFFFFNYFFFEIFSLQKTQKLKMRSNFKTQIVIKLKNSN